MNQYISGAFAFIGLAAVYLYAFKLSWSGKTSAAVFLLLVGGLGLRLFCGADMFLHEWDERYHALVAKNLGKHFLIPTLYDNPELPYSTTEWTSSHIWLHKQPVPLWVMALSIKLLGLNEWAVRLPSIIATTIAIKLLFDVAEYFTDIKTAFVAAFLCSVSGIILDVSSGRVSTDHIDSFFLFFTLLTVWCMVKYQLQRNRAWVIATGICLGLAILTKWLPALITIVVWAAIMRNKEAYTIKQITSNIIAALLIACTLVLPWHIYINVSFPTAAAIEYNLVSRHFSDVIENHDHNLFYHFDMLRIHHGELVYIPVIWFTWITLKKQGRKDLLAIAIWFWAIILFFSIAATKMQAYTLPAAPAVFIMIAYAYRRFIDFVSKTGYRFIGFAGALCLLILPARYTVERASFFAPKERQRDWAEAIKKWDYPAGTVVFNCEHPIEAMFYKDCTAYKEIPPSATIETLQRKGYHVVILP